MKIASFLPGNSLKHAKTLSWGCSGAQALGKAMRTTKVGEPLMALRPRVNHSLYMRKESFKEVETAA